MHVYSVRIECVLKSVLKYKPFLIKPNKKELEEIFNKKLETVFLPTAEEHLYLSSSLVKEVCSLGGDISGFVPREILQDVQNKIAGGV